MQNENDLLEWWKNLDLTWKRVFKRSLDINHNPSLEELYEILNLEVVDCSNTLVISLDPIKNFKKIRKLYCNNTQIIQIDKISNLTLIDELDCSYTKIKSLEPVMYLKNLWRLKCNNTELINLKGLENLQNLEYIDCSNTKINNINELIKLNSIKLIECNKIDIESLYPNDLFNLDNKIRVDGVMFDVSKIKFNDIDVRDSLFEDAARIIVQHQQGSTSLIQRKLKLGYSRASRIIDQLETFGIVGSFEGSKFRDVLLKDEYELEKHLNLLFRGSIKLYKENSVAFENKVETKNLPKVNKRSKKAEATIESNKDINNFKLNEILTENKEELSDVGKYNSIGLFLLYIAILLAFFSLVKYFY